MNILATTFFIVGLLCVVWANPNPLPDPAKGSSNRASYIDDDHFAIELRQASENVGADTDDDTVAASKPDSSSGRLFLKKLLFRNIFSSNSNQQPVIPIIITGAASTGGATATSPTVTITSTGTIPTATGTITTTPIGTPTTPARNKNEGEEGSYNGNGAAGGESLANIDMQALQAALVAGAQEYVVTDQEIRGTSDSKQVQNINLRRKGNKNSQIISVRVPPKYRRYFKNGQQVMLNSNRRAVKRRIVKKRGNKIRRRNGNKKNKNNRLA